MEAMTAARERWSDDRIDGLESKVDEGFRHVDQRFDHVDLRFDHIDLRFEEIDKRLEQIDTRLLSLDEGTRAFNRTMVMFCAVLLAAVIGLAGTVVTVAVV